MEKKKYKKIQRTFAVLLAVFVFFAAALSSLLIWGYAAESTARILPSYPQKDITALLDKEDWSENDYTELYRQTGLGKEALDDLKRLYPQYYDALILEFQEAFFYETELSHDMASFITPHDKIEGYFFPLAPLRNGDVIVTSSCHTFGWRNGHAALVVDAEQGWTLESITINTPSKLCEIDWFTTSSNFMILRLKEEYREQYDAEKIAADAVIKLYDVPYSLFVGFFSPKDQCANGRVITKTQCAHLVWQAFKNFGLDIDSDGGRLVTAQDIARSPYFEVVQVNGFDPDKLW